MICTPLLDLFFCAERLNKRHCTTPLIRVKIVQRGTGWIIIKLTPPLVWLMSDVFIDFVSINCADVNFQLHHQDKNIVSMPLEGVRRINNFIEGILRKTFSHDHLWLSTGNFSTHSQRKSGNAKLACVHCAGVRSAQVITNLRKFPFFMKLYRFQLSKQKSLCFCWNWKTRQKKHFWYECRPKYVRSCSCSVKPCLSYIFTKWQETLTVVCCYLKDHGKLGWSSGKCIFLINRDVCRELEVAKHQSKSSFSVCDKLSVSVEHLFSQRTTIIVS